MAVKLVRDRIREVDGYKDCEPGRFRSVRSKEEHLTLLLKKINEELGELLEAYLIKSDQHVNEEGCDLLEALAIFLMVATGITDDEIAELIDAKIAARGGFSGGLVWEHP